MSRYTPGPWKELIDRSGCVYVVGPDNEQEPLLGGEEIGHTDFVCYIGDMETTEGKDHANARLISAAPDLLAAVEAFIKAEDLNANAPDYPDEIIGDEIALAFDDAAQMARAALAKAKGEPT